MLNLFMQFLLMLVPNLYLSKNYEKEFLEMSNLAVFHISVAFKISFNNAKGFIDTNICRKNLFQGVMKEPRTEICFLRQSLLKYFATK